MQKIDNIEIKNFKSIRHQKIEGCKRINVFIGYPNVGKSNILEALSLFSLLETYKIKFNEIIRTNELSQLFVDGDITSKIEININSYLNAQIIHLDNGCEFEIYSTEKEKGTVAPIVPEDVNQKHHLTLLKAILLNPSEIELSFQASLTDKIWAKQIKPIKRYLFDINHVSKISNSLNYLSVPFGDNISRIIFSIPNVKKEIINLLEKFPLSIATSQDSSGIKFLKRLNDGTHFILDFQMIADTLQRLIFHKTAIASNKNSILLFEEPEAHMFPPYISKFTSDVTYDEQDNQFFITTHSPFVINDFMENLTKDEYSLYTVGYSKETGETLIRRMTDEELHEIYQYGVDLFLNLENYLPQENNIHEQQQ